MYCVRSSSCTQCVFTMVIVIEVGDHFGPFALATKTKREVVAFKTICSFVCIILDADEYCSFISRQKSNEIRFNRLEILSTNAF